MSQRESESLGPTVSSVSRPVSMTHADDVSLREHLKQLLNDSEKLIRQEIELAVADVDVRANRLKKEVAGAAVGGAVLYAGVLALVAALVLLLDLAMATWLAALIVGAVTATGGFTLVQKAKKEIKPGEVVPQRSISSVRKDAQMLKEATR